MIVTFYSYKGGVGRSMAVANTALLLAQRGLRVLVVDWDLEAPGIERYFSCFSVESLGTGLMGLLTDTVSGNLYDYQSYLWKIKVDNGIYLNLLPSGKEDNPNYTNQLEKFDWQCFFSNNGGSVLEKIRQQWLENFDFVLIDSRTGLSDSGGICTIFFPDVVVAMFTANHQSLYGIRDVLRLAQRARQNLAYDRMPLTILPLPSRFGTRAEFKESQEWINRFEEAMEEFFEDWLPKTVRPREVLERLKVPQIDYFGFGEKLAVVEQGVNDPEGMGFVYDKIATILAANFQNVGDIVGIRADPTLVLPSKKMENKVKFETGYEYDVFVSYSRGTTVGSEIIRESLKCLKDWYQSLYGKELEIFYDVTELSIGGGFNSDLMVPLLRSRMLLVFATPRYFANSINIAEWNAFDSKSKRFKLPLILPILVSGKLSDVPKQFKQSKWLDLASESITGYNNRDKFGLQISLKKVAERFHDILEKVPSFDSKFDEVITDGKLLMAWAKNEVKTGNIGSIDTPNSARWLFKKGLEADPTNVPVIIAWATTESNNNNLGDVHSEFTARWLFKLATTMDNSSALIRHTWALAETKMMNFGAIDEEYSARWLFNIASQMDPNNPKILHSWAQVETKAGNYGDYESPSTARWLFKRAFEADSKNALLILSWAIAEGNQGFIGDIATMYSARWLFNRASQLDPKNVQIWQAWAVLESRYDSALASIRRAEILKEMGKYPDALAAYHNTIIDFPDSVVARTGLAELLKDMGKYQEALIAYEEIIYQFPDSSVAHTGRAEVLIETGNYEEALLGYKNTLERFPNNIVARTGLAGVLKEMGKYADALIAYQSTIDCFPDDVIAKVGRADVLKAMGRYEESLAAYLEIIKCFPLNVIARCGRAEVLRMIGRYAEALAAYEETSEGIRDNVMALCGRAEVLKEMGNCSAALAAYNEIVERFPNNVWAHSRRDGILQEMQKGLCIIAQGEITAGKPEDDSSQEF